MSRFAQVSHFLNPKLHVNVGGDGWDQFEKKSIVSVI